MLGISDNKDQVKMAKNLKHQFMFMVKKIKDIYQILFNLVKNI